MLIEDETFIRELYIRSLTKEGFEVLAASEGKTGLKLAKVKPDLILLDIMLPKIHGLDVLKILKTQPETKEVPVMLLTNLGDESIIKETLRMGAVDYLVKVRLTPSQIVSRVAKFLKKLD